jgi:hypothetical protein
MSFDDQWIGQHLAVNGQTPNQIWRNAGSRN